jgi:hypothetical protein
MGHGWGVYLRRGRWIDRMIEQWGPARAAVAISLVGFATGSLIAIVNRALGSRHPIVDGISMLVVVAASAGLSWKGRPWRVYLALLLAMALGLVPASLATDFF